MSTHARALEIATLAHVGKGGGSYLAHALRVLMEVRSPLEKTTALLHDVVKDSPWTLERLREEGFPAEVIAAVDALTPRAPAESEDEFLDRVALNPIAREVKLADLKDEMDLRSIQFPTEADLNRVARCQRVFERLGGSRSELESLLARNAPRADEWGPIEFGAEREEEPTSFRVHIDDNFHYMDESERRFVGRFQRYFEAVAWCRARVDDSLRECYEPGMAPAQLLGRYKMFGEDPWVDNVPTGERRWSAWGYAAVAAKAVCAAQSQPPEATYEHDT